MPRSSLGALVVAVGYESLETGLQIPLDSCTRDEAQSEMTALTWFTRADDPRWFNLLVDGSTIAMTDSYIFRARQTTNGRFALAVFHRALGGQVFAKHYVSLRGAQTAAQRWLDKQAVRV